MLPEELELYNNLINLLNDYRQGILHNLIEGKLPLIQNSKRFKNNSGAWKHYIIKDNKSYPEIHR